MVSVVGGLLSNTLWRAVGGDTHSTGRDTVPGGRLGVESKTGHVKNSFNTTHAHYIKNAIPHAHDGGVGSSRIIGTAHYCDINCGRDNRRHGCMGGVHSLQEVESDWVMCDTTTVPCKSTVALSSSPPYSTTSALSTSPKMCASCPGVNCIFNKYGSSPCLTDFEVPTYVSPPADRAKSTCSETSNQNTIIDRVGIKSTVCPSGDHPIQSTHTCDECPVKIEAFTATKTCQNVYLGSGSSTSINSSTLTTPGNCSGWQDREAWRRQYVLGRQRNYFSTRCGNCATFHACAMSDAHHTKDNTIETVTTKQVVGEDVPLPPEPPPVSPKSPIVDCIRNTTMDTAAGAMDCCSVPNTTNDKTCGLPAIPYREDIRAYDIYKITPHLSTEAHYSRLPAALPSLSDSDSDPEDLRTGQGVRKRKRSGRREGEGGKRYREREESDKDEQERRIGLAGLDDITVYSSPSLEDYTNRISILHRLSSGMEGPCSSSSVSSDNVQRHDSFSNTITPYHHQHFGSRPTTTTPTATTNTFSQSNSSIKDMPSKQPFSPLKITEDDDVPSDDNSLNNDDEDDDDEDSTVVPDDFDDDETDSDIEVLAQSESWVDLSNQPAEEGPDRVTPLPFGNGEEYIRLLREAQKESNQSSARVSLASSRRDTPRDSPHDSPKSPPNSPNTELTTDPEETVLKGVYINYYNKEGDFMSPTCSILQEGDFIRVEKNTDSDWIWDWSSRPDQTPPKEWRFSHPGKGVNRGASIRRVMVGKSSLFSRDVLYTLLITNVLSLLIGTGIGIWLSKRSSSGAIVTLPIN